MRRFVGIILNAKYRVEKDHKDIGVIIPLDDEELKFLMTKALRRYFNALRTCLDTLTFDLILVKLDQKQEFLIHEKLCTPL